jgi:hypothetical protein
LFKEIFDYTFDEKCKTNEDLKKLFNKKTDCHISFLKVLKKVKISIMLFNNDQKKKIINYLKNQCNLLNKNISRGSAKNLRGNQVVVNQPININQELFIEFINDIFSINNLNSKISEIKKENQEIGQQIKKKLKSNSENIINYPKDIIYQLFGLGKSNDKCKVSLKIFNLLKFINVLSSQSIIENKDIKNKIIIKLL